MADANFPPHGEHPITNVDGLPADVPLARPLSSPTSPPVDPRHPSWEEEGPRNDVDEAASEYLPTISSVSGKAASGSAAISSRGGASPSGPVPAEGAREADPHLVDMAPVVRESPPWLISAVLHMALMILLGLLFAGQTSESRLSLEAAYTEEIGEQILEENLELAEQEFDMDEQVITPDDLPEVEDPLANPTVTEIDPLPTQATSDLIPTTIGMALSGRTKGTKEALLKAYGGNDVTEGAVVQGLRWLMRQQRNNGLWSLQGPYSDGARVENFDAATAMALLAFQGAGHTHMSSESDPFQHVVEKGWDALSRRQNDDGCFFNNAPEQHRFYTHAQCSIALCELYGMTHDESLRVPAQAAIDYLVRTQQPEGGWKYYLNSGNDLSVTGWVVMALQSARMAGLDVPSETLMRVREFLDSVAKDGGSRYSYEPRLGDKLSMTAEGLLCRQYLGWQYDDNRLRRGCEVLAQNPPFWRRGEVNTYYWYYATQVLHHMGSHWWNDWNLVMREELPAQQVPRGRERGSWDPEGDRWADGGRAGRLYMTCLSIYMLEVYYRHLPIYQEGILEP